MYRTYFKQAIQMLKQNPFISIISTLGTALAIMMIMVVIVSANIHNVNVKPEANRGRSFYSNGYVTVDTVRGLRSWGELKYDFVHDFFYTLQVPELVTAFEWDYLQGYRQGVVSREGDKEYHKINLRLTDNVFWKVFSFDFVKGSPFTQEEFESGIRKAVITRSLARRLFKGEEPVGRHIRIDNVPYTISGVVNDVSPVFKMAYGDVWAPYISKAGYKSNSFPFQVVMVAKDPNDYPRIAEEVTEMERLYGARHAGMVMRFGAPSDHAGFDGTEVNDSYKKSYEIRQGMKFLGRLRTGFLFLILLLVPAMNLSGFSVSRMKKRTEEIGIRKAFGAKTGTVLLQVLYENIITSLIGGILGLVFSYAAIFLMKGWILGIEQGASIPIKTLVSPMIFGLVIVFCVLLSLISSGIPAIRASRKKIVDSITKNDR